MIYTFTTSQRDTITFDDFDKQIQNLVECSNSLDILIESGDNQKSAFRRIIDTIVEYLKKFGQWLAKIINKNWDKIRDPFVKKKFIIYDNNLDAKIEDITHLLDKGEDFIKDVKNDLIDLEYKPKNKIDEFIALKNQEYWDLISSCLKYDINCDNDFDNYIENITSYHEEEMTRREYCKKFKQIAQDTANSITFINRKIALKESFLGMFDNIVIFQDLRELNKECTRWVRNFFNIIIKIISKISDCSKVMYQQISGFIDEEEPKKSNNTSNEKKESKELVYKYSYTADYEDKSNKSPKNTKRPKNESSIFSNIQII